MELDEATREKSAFITYGGLWEFQTLPCNAPATFQRLMESVLRGLTYKIALCYIDDIIIYSRNFEQHLCDLRDVFDRLREANIRLKPTKCHFAATEIEYLGHTISAKGIAPNPDKIKAVIEFPIPINVKGVRSFLG